MAALAVWMDRHEAKIFLFRTEGVETRHLKAHGGIHPSGHGKEHDLHKFFHDLTVELTKSPVQACFLMGPGVAKEQFKHDLEAKHPQLAKCIVGMESTDHLSDAQLQDHARRFFKHRGVFEGL